MKKTFFLPKGLEKFTNLQADNLDLVKGGAIYVEEEIYYPTSGGGRVCPDGLVWSNKLQKCVKLIEVEAEKEHFRL
ncbi:hypothetical protein MHM83_08865 [Tenacibaculum sp. Mcav3-52]|uniref:hypothetical protein n=1 Tax=Tenacibaculum TaxID=104267 RepID=UPI0012E58B11|nr:MULTISPECIES: hypothetical protein [Tenacibaculum]GFD75624.1 hypothetical protein KUL113_50440 [Tenacibaculum sp. KUL113]GFD81264.1 hypothetical protein KUL118_41260 [Tenacibaculum sp. KUL118]KAF9659767.1 hypothetical protein HBA12_05885 [Tenacibaculum mesophilum]MCG7501979.1 hypothetical protein [Tenacibaculum sp. Mcav3-52]MCO7185269.1 hypothetical protein [Tenacibaculum sp. XPcli2-G]